MIKLLTGAALAAGLMAGGAQATTLTFEGLAPASSIGAYGGLNFSAAFFAQDGSGSAYKNSGFQNGIISPNSVAYNAFGGGASFSAPTAFTLNSFYLSSAWNDGLQVWVTGKLNGVLWDSTVLLVNTSGPTLETLNWGNINEVDFSSFGGVLASNVTGSGTQFVLDNLTYSGGVPEPATWAMLILGMGVTGAVLRRRREAAIAPAEVH